MEEPMKALIQSFSRTKARNLAEYKKVMDAHTNSSNNTLYADADGNIAYFHSNFIPKRDPKFDWTKPVDGSNPATEWNGVLSFDESPNVVNPKNGWVYNTNNYPFSAAGPGNSPKQKAFPAYVDSGSENPRGVHAIKVLTGKKGFTIDTLITEVAFDSFQPEFEILIPLLVKAHAGDAGVESAEGEDRRGDRGAEGLGLSMGERRRCRRAWPSSTATTCARACRPRRARRTSRSTSSCGRRPRRSSASNRSPPRSDKLAADFGKWQTPWGDINRFQRNDGAIVQKFDDSKPSTPVMFASATLGFAGLVWRARLSGHQEVVRHQRQQLRGRGRIRRSVKAKAVTAGGLNSVPGSKHFNDQAERYATGNLRDVYFYREQLKGHTEREYKPGAIDVTGHRHVRRQDHAAGERPRARGTQPRADVARQAVSRRSECRREGRDDHRRRPRGEGIGGVLRGRACQRHAARQEGQLRAAAHRHHGPRQAEPHASRWSPIPATGELAGLTGRMDIIIEGKQHSYVFEYEIRKG